MFTLQCLLLWVYIAKIWILIIICWLWSFSLVANSHYQHANNYNITLHRHPLINIWGHKRWARYFVNVLLTRSIGLALLPLLKFWQRHQSFHDTATAKRFDQFSVLEFVGGSLLCRLGKCLQHIPRQKVETQTHKHFEQVFVYTRFRFRWRFSVAISPVLHGHGGYLLTKLSCYRRQTSINKWPPVFDFSHGTAAAAIAPVECLQFSWSD